MKKYFLLLAAALLCASCVIEEGSGSDAERTTTTESHELVLEYTVEPSELLAYLIEVDDYLNADEEEKKDAKYDEIRKNLLRDEYGRYIIEELFRIAVDGKRFTEAGSLWTVEGGTYWAQYAVCDTLRFNCLESGSKWSVAISSGASGTFTALGSNNFKVELSGAKKSLDGYDLVFRTKGDFEVRLEESGYFEKPHGTFYHTVGRDGNILKECTVEYPKEYW